jgi:hypothetical protein
MGGGGIIVVNRVTANHSAAGVIIMSVGASNGKLHFKRLERQVFVTVSQYSIYVPET